MAQLPITQTKRKMPPLSNQYGAWVMAFLPFCYGVSLGNWQGIELGLLLCWALSWAGFNLFSYPFFSLFSRKPSTFLIRWAVNYFSIALLFALPVIIYQPLILQFWLIILPLAVGQIYFAKQKNERHFINDILGISIFGLFALSVPYLNQQSYLWQVALHPILFFIADTLYIKSVLRERKNRRYYYASLFSHFLGCLIYAYLGHYWLMSSYLFGLMRAMIMPKLNWKAPKIGMLEFLIMGYFLLSLIVQ